MGTDRLIEEYTKNGINFHKRAVCDDAGNIISYTYTAYFKHPLAGIDCAVADNEIEAVEKLRKSINKVLDLINENKYYIDNFLMMPISSEIYIN